MTASGIEELCGRIQKAVTVITEVMAVKMDCIQENTEPSGKTIQEGGVGEEKLLFPLLS